MRVYWFCSEKRAKSFKEASDGLGAKVEGRWNPKKMPDAYTVSTCSLGLVVRPKAVSCN